MSDPTSTPAAPLAVETRTRPARLHGAEVDVDPVGRLVLDRGLGRRLRRARGQGGRGADQDGGQRGSRTPTGAAEAGREGTDAQRDGHGPVHGRQPSGSVLLFVEARKGAPRRTSPPGRREPRALHVARRSCQEVNHPPSAVRQASDLRKQGLSSREWSGPRGILVLAKGENSTWFSRSAKWSCTPTTGRH